MKNIILILSVVFMTSCANIELFNKDSQVINITKGQELIDLKKALDSGAITQEEYDELKSKIVDVDKETND